MLIPRKDDNASENFGLYKDKESILEEQDIKKDHTNLVGKSLDIESRARDGLSRRTPLNGPFASELSSSLREVRFSKQEFPTNKPISDIKYHHSGSQNNNLFHPFNDQLDYIFASYFEESETTKGNIDRFLFNPLINQLTQKLSY